MHTRARHLRELADISAAATAVALSLTLGMLRLVELPNGGSISLAAIPLLACSILRGARVGILVGVCTGAAHLATGATVVHPLQLLLDYGAAYAALGLCGLLAGASATRQCQRWAITCAMLAQTSAFVVSGMVFFSPVGGTSALIYSATYNAATAIPEWLLALAFTPAFVTAMLRGEGRTLEHAHRALRPRVARAAPQLSPSAPKPYVEPPAPQLPVRAPRLLRPAPFPTSSAS